MVTVENVVVEKNEAVARVTKRQKSNKRSLAMKNVKQWKLKVRIHATRIYVMMLNYLFGHDWVFSMIGLTAKYVFRKPIKSAFLLYPGHKKYSQAYVYEWYRAQMQWKPRLIGVLWQNGTFSFTFAVSACDGDFYRDDGTNLRHIYERIQTIKKKLRADQMSFAGILPGVLMSKGIMTSSVEREVTVPAVVKAVDKVMQRENMPSHTAIVVIGGNGFIGRPIVETLRKKYHNAVISIDLANKENFFNLQIQSAIVLNVTKKGGLQEYISHLHDGMVVVNEVYPAPRRKVVEAIKARGAKIFHINGIKGGALPPFPHDYHGGIPCCAGHIPANLDEMEIVVSEL